MSDDPKIVDEWRSNQGSMVVTQPAPGVLLFTYHGHADATVVPVLKRVVDRAIAAGYRPDLLVDCWDMSGYDTDFRVDATKWGQTVKGKIGIFHFLVRSKIVAMGVSVANLAIGGIFTASSTREAFEETLGKAVRKAKAAGPAKSASI